MVRVFTAFLLFLHFLLVPLLAQAGVLKISRAQAREYLLAQGLPMEDGIRGETLQAAMAPILEHTLLARAWDGLGNPLDPGQRSQMELMKQELAVRLCREKRLKVDAVSDTQVEDYAYLARWLYFPSHILVEDAPTADSIFARLERGSNFAQQARRFSKDPGSAALGGALGPVQAGQTVMEFEEVMLHLKPGEMARPVRSPFGWHIIRLDSLQELPDAPLDEAGRAALRQTLERNARRKAELGLQQWLEREHGLSVDSKAAVGTSIDSARVVAQSRDTSLTRAQLDAMISAAFGGQGAPALDGLGADFARYWLEQDAWLREARRDGTWKSRELKDLVELRERLFKSALFVNLHLASSYTPTEQDLENYLDAHPVEFLAERAFNLWTFSFNTRAQADSARALSRRELLDPSLLAERLGLDLHPRQWQAAEVASLPSQVRGALVELDPLEWSDVLELPDEDGVKWVFFSLLGRTMPFLGESASLRKAVDEKVRAAVITAEIGRVVEELKSRTGLTEVHWKD